MQISFSKKNSIKILKENNLSIKQKIRKRYGKNEGALAIFRRPEIIEDFLTPKECKGFDTIIILELKRQIENVLEEQLKKTVDPEMMLFLNHLESIEIQTPNIKQKLKRK